MTELNFRLYLITDRHQCQGRQLTQVVDEACKAGVKAVQLREKDLSPFALYQLAEHIKEVCQSTHTKLFINDRADIAQAVQADGIQLTSQSLPVEAVRRCLLDRKLIGVSTHSLEEAQRAEESAADFILFGPIFETPSKAGFGKPQGLARLNQLAKLVGVPVFAVGGINPERAKQCMENRAAGVAVISSIMSSPNIKTMVRRYEHVLGSL
ncbi:MAG: thiamine phosphate synthase [bacterium]